MMDYEAANRHLR